ncbi:MAG: hypothetical protein HZC28_12810 [Spirochaetes bacterium]|nr:hypothetical protein [Spirochaetota bacterium]
MNPYEVKERIYVEIKDWHITNVDGCSLDMYLVEPEKAPIKCTFNGVTTTEYWIVFEEDPVNRTGIKIFYNEEDDMFGLAKPDESGDIVSLGHYGTFLNTLEAM